MLSKFLNSKFFDFIYIFSALFMIGLLVFVLYHAVSYWSFVFPHILTVQEQMFYLAILIAIVTSIGQWIGGRIEAITKTIHKSKGGKK